MEVNGLLGLGLLLRECKECVQLCEPVTGRVKYFPRV